MVWQGRNCTGELERSQLVVCTVVEMKVLLDFKNYNYKPSPYKPRLTIWASPRLVVKVINLRPPVDVS
jgi:hypothetical protein